MADQCNKLIIGAGLYGLYSSLFSARQGDNVILIESEDAPFKRATYVNQARVHMGYHYPRSYSTAIKSREYFDRFYKDYGYCINTSFDQIYATSNRFSWTKAEQFRKFCRNANIPCSDVSLSEYFNNGMCDGAFLTKEYTYDAQILKKKLLDDVEYYSNISCMYSTTIRDIKKIGNNFIVSLSNGEEIKTNFILNATYAGINHIHNLMSYEPFKIKYELCEIILCKVNDEFQNKGITVMDGPFFSIMPFGKTGYHSLTSVTFTPHITSFDAVPTFQCQQQSNGFCTTDKLWNCNECPAKPQSAWPYMSSLAKKYLLKKFEFEYVDSLYSMKPILKASEIDDSRPTLIRQFSSNPTFISVLSGKINTVYDLDEVLKHDNH